MLELAGGVGAVGEVAGAEEDVVVWVLGGELFGDFETEALVGAGDEDDGFGGGGHGVNEGVWFQAAVFAPFFFLSEEVFLYKS